MYDSKGAAIWWGKGHLNVCSPTLAAKHCNTKESVTRIILRGAAITIDKDTESKHYDIRMQSENKKTLSPRTTQSRT
jgi:intein-encoded DNA endonuclease-like protein